MLPISDLRGWAGVTSDSSDSTLRSLEAGAVELLEQATNRKFRSPPEQASIIVDGPAVDSGGLTGTGVGPQQWVTLTEEPKANLSGTVTVAIDSKAVAGVGTKFQSELNVNSAILIGAENLLVGSIESDTALTLEAAHAAGSAGTQASAGVISIETRGEGSSTWTAEDPREFEFERRRVYSPTSLFPPGRRTVRVNFTLGFEEGQAPAGAALLVGRMVKSLFRRFSTRGEKSVSVFGGFSITWATLAEEAAEFERDARLLSRGLTFS